MYELERSLPPDSELLLDLAIDSWKFARLFSRVLTKLEAGEHNRFANQLLYFQRRIDSTLSAIGARLESLEGLPFEAGMAASPLNLQDFQDGDLLVIDQMLEPIVMGPEGVLRMGTLMLRKV
ncbi:hypothetical protein ELE36_09260 [Pseudolysobacter antarcticus]|uniref:Uncharacterized protein n=1 Tax=Pseudolysobacter antarcticus TaxID=2511995 RepID=A0A411HJ60_9GAMM|nr:hypothetical protein [Pseudolysobacter antarcticus]QBB70535.1 hypothetical protein ELE36_09260 [Pseudolysobacter antarcticus]